MILVVTMDYFLPASSSSQRQWSHFLNDNGILVLNVLV